MHSCQQKCGLKVSFLLFNRSGFISRWISGAFTFADPFVVSGEPAAGFDLAACRSFVALRRRFLVRRSFFTTLKMTMHKLRQISAIGKNALSDINIMIRARWRLISESKVKPFLLWGSIKQNRLAEKSNFWVLRTTLCISN